MKTISIDFSDPAIQRDPYTHYEKLRAESPVCWNGRTWVIARYNDITTLMTDPRMSSARTEQIFAVLPPEAQQEMAPLRTILGSRMLLTDPPRHTRLKGIVAKAFTPRVSESRRARVTEICNQFIDAQHATGRLEVMEDVAAKLPGWAIANILGVPYRDQAQFTQWARDQVAIYDRAGQTQDRVGIMRRGQTAMMAMKAYVEVEIEKRRADPQDDLLTELVQAEEQGDRLSTDELFGMCVAILVGGNNSTAHLIGQSILTFSRHPEALAQLLANPELIAPALEEVMRYDSPVQVTSRLAKERMEFGGEVFEAGQGVLMLLGSGNRDEAAFDRPKEFVMTRSPNRHLTFGHGPHYCLGTAIGRMVAQVGVMCILQRCRNPRLLIDHIDWLPGFAFRGPEKLPIAFDAP